MGPRREHNRQEFTDLVADAAEAIVRRSGVQALGMRPLSAAIGYAPNSVYNAIGGLPAVVLLVNSRTLSRLRATLEQAASTSGGREPILAIAEAYLDYVESEPNLWDLLLGYVRPPGTPLPEDLGTDLRAASGVVLHALEGLVAPRDIERTAAALWAGLQGIAALGRSRRLQLLAHDDPRTLARFLVTRLVPACRDT